MKILVSLSTTAALKGGVETFGDHLQKAIPGLRVVHASLLPPAGELFPLFKHPLAAKRLDHWLLDHLADYAPEAVFTSGMDGWALSPSSVGCPVINIQHGTFAAFADAALPRVSLSYWRTRLIYAHYERLAARRASRVVANSPFTRRNVRRHYKVESEVIPLAIDIEQFRPIPQDRARAALHLPADQQIAVFVGRPDRSKGYDLLLRLAALLPDTLFLAVFPFPSPSPLPNVRTFAGIPHARLAAFYSAADVCVNPTRFEGFGYVPLEALACNIPVVGTSTGILADADLPGFSPARTLADYLTLLPQAEGGRSRPAVAEAFSFTRFRQRYKQLLENL